LIQPFQGWFEAKAPQGRRRCANPGLSDFHPFRMNQSIELEPKFNRRDHNVNRAYGDGVFDQSEDDSRISRWKMRWLIFCAVRLLSNVARSALS